VTTRVTTRKRTKTHSVAEPMGTKTVTTAGRAARPTKQGTNVRLSTGQPPRRKKRAAKKSDLFEQRIHRIHELLEESGAAVTWNDRVPDPDNPSQLRQIDVTVKRAGLFVLIECRLHRKPQGVKWIEELIGRRISLRAAEVIAVSSSGFSKGAKVKAAQHRVQLRNLRELSDPEILEWGRSVTLSLLCYQYSELTLSLLVDGDGEIDSAVANELPLHPINRLLFNAAADYFTAEGLITPRKIDQETRFGIEIEPPADIRIGGRRIRSAGLDGKASVLVLSVCCPVVEAYAAPASAPAAIVERFELGETSIVHEGERVAIFVDVSVLELPPLCQCQFVRTAGDQEMDCVSFSLVGVEKLFVIRPGPINLRIGAFRQDRS